MIKPSSQDPCMSTIATVTQYTPYAGWLIKVWREAGGWSARINRTVPPLHGQRDGPIEIGGGPWPTAEEALLAARATCDAEDRGL